MYTNEIHYFSGRALSSCIIYHQLTCRNSMIICTHSKSQAIFTRADYNINLFPSFLDFHSAVLTIGNPGCRFSHFMFYDDDKICSLKKREILRVYSLRKLKLMHKLMCLINALYLPKADDFQPLSVLSFFMYSRTISNYTDLVRTFVKVYYCIIFIIS